MEIRALAYLTGIFVLIFFLTLGIYIGLSLQIEERPKTPEPDFDFSHLDFETSRIYIPGVDNKGEGVLAILETNIREGKGFVLVNINDVIAGPSTQGSARNAAKIAKNYSDIQAPNMDVIYNIKTDVDAIDGPSAGAAMTISLLSLIQNKSLNENVSITGFVDKTGKIMPAVGIEQKAKALSEQGVEILLVSDQVALPMDYLRREKCETLDGIEYCEIDYIPEGDLEVSGVSVVPIRDINEAIEYMII